MQEGSSSPVAQLVAKRIIFVAMLTFAFSAIATIGGNGSLALQICAGGAVIAVIVFVLGGLAVAATKDEGESEG
ncbi:MAG: hypothetical protein SFZ02_11810 [bacterium]|nr:hypothetical protein [bacterium]